MMEIPIEQVMIHEKTLPLSYLNERGNDVTEEFIQWCKPLIGGELQNFMELQIS